jgi:hypothetical protein
MSKRIGLEYAVLRLRGCSANWMPLAIGLEPMAPSGSIGQSGVDVIGHNFEHEQ